MVRLLKLLELVHATRPNGLGALLQAHALDLLLSSAHLKFLALSIQHIELMLGRFAISHHSKLLLLVHPAVLELSLSQGAFSETESLFSPSYLRVSLPGSGRGSLIGHVLSRCGDVALDGG